MAYGTRAAVRIGAAIGVTPPARAARIEGLLDRLELGRAPLPYPLEAVLAATATDKKHAAGGCAGCSRRPTATVVRDDVPQELVADAAAAILRGSAAAAGSNVAPGAIP